MKRPGLPEVRASRLPAAGRQARTRPRPRTRRDYEPGHTTRSGLGWAHQKDRKNAIRILQDGTPCPRCGQPMYKAQAALLDLDHVIPRALGGGQGPKVLAHRRCNRRAGAVLGNRLRAARRQAAYSRW